MRVYVDPCSFRVDLELAPYDNRASYGCRNLPDQFQRPHVIDRASSDGMHIQCDITNVVHGTLSPGGPPATLIIFRFRFLGSKTQGASERFRKVTINVSFFGGEKADAKTDAEVVAIAPDDETQWDFTIRNGQTKFTANMGLSLPTSDLMKTGGGFPVPSASYSFERTTDTHEEGYTMLFGCKKYVGRMIGTKNGAAWKLAENPVKQTGIPPKLTTAVLLRPSELNGGYFQARVDIVAEVDLMYRLKEKFEKLIGTHVVDPVFFKHGLPMVGLPIPGVDVDNLGELESSGKLASLAGCI